MNPGKCVEICLVAANIHYEGETQLLPGKLKKKKEEEEEWNRKHYFNFNFSPYYVKVTYVSLPDDLLQRTCCYAVNRAILWLT